MSKLLVVIDYQTDFVSGALGFEQARNLESPLFERVQTALACGWKVLFTRDTHCSDYLNSREGKFLPVPHCLKDSEGWHLYGKLTQFEQTANLNIAFLDKPTFGSADLGQAVQTLCGGAPEEIEVCGVVTNICVISNAIVLHSTFLDSSIAVNGSLCAAPNPDDHENALRLLAGMGYPIL